MGLRGPKAATAKVTCWCEARIVRVPWSWVGKFTRSCGGTGCRAPR